MELELMRYGVGMNKKGFFSLGFEVGYYVYGIDFIVKFKFLRKIFSFCEFLVGVRL